MQPVFAISGANGALGQALVNRALASGAKVAATSRKAWDAPVAETLLVIDGIDAAVEEDAAQACARINAHFGKLDVLINVAGAFDMGEAETSPPNIWQRMYSANLQTALNMSRSALPYLKSSPHGRIINTGAISALHAGAGMGPYAAAKSAVHRLTESMAAELIGRVTVNAVLPSIIDTPQNRTAMPDADHSSWVMLDEVASAIMFLASKAASGITGALVPVRGRTI